MMKSEPGNSVNLNSIPCIHNLSEGCVTLLNNKAMEHAEY